MTASTAFITERRERTFLVLAGVFLSAMTLLNVVGITRFIQFGPLALAALRDESGAGGHVSVPPAPDCRA